MAEQKGQVAGSGPSKQLRPVSEQVRPSALVTAPNAAAGMEMPAPAQGFEQMLGNPRFLGAQQQAIARSIGRAGGNRAFSFDPKMVDALVVLASRDLGADLCLEKVRHGDQRQNCDDRHDDQQFNECESLSVSHFTKLLPPGLTALCYYEI